MNKVLKISLIVLAILIVVAGTVVFVAISIHNSKYISKSEAIEIATSDAGIDQIEIVEAEADFEKTNYSAWYEVEIKTHTAKYEYDIDAVSGKILSSNTKTRN